MCLFVKAVQILHAIQMALLENYRSSNDYREILRILQKASSLQENFLWQTHSMGRTIIPISHFEIDFVGREVVMVFDPRRFKLDPELPLYVKLDYHSSVFKVMDFRQIGDAIHFTFPEELKTLELRDTKRHVFLPNEEKAVSLKPSLPGKNSDNAPELFFRTVDISTNGLGLLVSEANRSFLKNNRILWITRLGDESLKEFLLAEVVYINSDVDPKYQVKKQKILKVGLKVSGTFNPTIYHRFIS